MACLAANDGCLAAVGRAVVDDPEEALGGAVRLDRHDLIDEAAERSDAGPGLAATEEASPMDVPAHDVLEGAKALVLVLDAQSPSGSRWQAGVAAPPHLDRGLLVRRDHEFVWAQAPTTRLCRLRKSVASVGRRLISSALEFRSGWTAFVGSLHITFVARCLGLRAVA
jgi:hypothetical protein